MIKSLIFAACLIALPVSALATPSDDAAFIARQHILISDYKAELAELKRANFVKLEPGMKTLGATILDQDAFMDALMGDFLTAFEPRMAALTTQVFIDTLTPAELAALADFYRSEKGQAYIADQPTFWTSPIRYLSFAYGPGAPLLRYLSDLEARVAAERHAHFNSTESLFKMDRFADLFEDPSLVAFADEKTRATVVDALRAQALLPSGSSANEGQPAQRTDSKSLTAKP